MANTTWSGTDHSANIALSGGNLTATASGAGATWVRAVDTKLPAAGKFYWEVRPSVWVSGISEHGFCPSALSNPNGSSNAGLSAIDRTGAIWINGGFSGISLTGITPGTSIISIALDLVGNLVWYRVAPSGNWNNSGTASPGGTGGINVSSITGVDAVPVAMFGTTSDAVVANFGDSAFSGAVPGGFTAGWPGAAVAGSAQARALVLA